MRSKKQITNVDIDVDVVDDVDVVAVQ